MKLNGWVIFDIMISICLWLILLYCGVHIWAWGYKIWQTIP